MSSSSQNERCGEIGFVKITARERGLRKVDVELYGREEPLGGEVKEENLAGMRLLPSLMHRRWTKNGRAQQLMFS